MPYIGGILLAKDVQLLMVLLTILASANIGALTKRIAFWGHLYYNYNKEPPQQYR